MDPVLASGISTRSTHLEIEEFSDLGKVKFKAFNSKFESGSSSGKVKEKIQVG